MESGERNVCRLEDVPLISPKGFGDLKCTHFLCEECWRNTAKIKPLCPLCREDIRTWMESMGYDICTESIYNISYPSDVLSANANDHRYRMMFLAAQLSGPRPVIVLLIPSGFAQEDSFILGPSLRIRSAIGRASGFSLPTSIPDISGALESLNRSLDRYIERSTALLDSISREESSISQGHIGCPLGHPGPRGHTEPILKREQTTPTIHVHKRYTNRIKKQEWNKCRNGTCENSKFPNGNSKRNLRKTGYRSHRKSDRGIKTNRR